MPPEINEMAEAITSFICNDADIAMATHLLMKQHLTPEVMTICEEDITSDSTEAKLYWETLTMIHAQALALAITKLRHWSNAV